MNQFGHKCNGKNACTVRSPVRTGDEEERAEVMRNEHGEMSVDLE